LGGVAVAAPPAFFGWTQVSVLPLPQENTGCTIADGEMTMKYLAIGTIAAIVVTTCAGCVEQESRSAAAEWIGKDRVQLAQQMGAPRLAVPMTDTGGEELFYSFQGHHYYFQTNPQGLIDSAVRTD
jgi:hypothetical protein